MAQLKYPQLKMEYPGIRSAANTWELFKNVNRYRRVDLVHEWMSIGCELSIPKNDVDAIRQAIVPLLETGMTFKPTKTVAYVNLRSTPIDHFADFESLVPAVEEALQKLERLRLFSAKDAVDNVIRRYAKP